MAVVKPHPAVHHPWMFLCSIDDPDAAVVSLAENPAGRIASELLEDIGDWHQALKNLQKTDVPPGVATALDQLHEAVCGWTTWCEQQTAKHIADTREKAEL